MASYQRLCITSCTIFFCLLSLSSSQKVTLSLYYEALCPFCAEFIVNRLPKIFETGLISSIDLQLVPWGNAAIRPDGTILCQMKHFGYIYCTEQLVLENKLEKWADCLEMVGLSRAAVDCYINGYGNQVNPEACRILNSSVETLSRSNSSVEKLSNSPQVCYSNHSQNLLLSNSFYTLRLDLQQSAQIDKYKMHSFSTSNI